MFNSFLVVYLISEVLQLTGINTSILFCSGLKQRHALGYNFNHQRARTK